MTTTTTPTLTIADVHPVVPVLAPAAGSAGAKGAPPEYAPGGPFDQPRPASKRAGQRSYLAPVAFLVGAAGLFVLPLPLGIAAMCIAGVALPRIRSNPVAKGGGLALAGLVIGAIDVGFWVVWMLTHLEDGPTP